MNDPRNEIVSVVKSLTLAPTVAAQRTAISKYFAPDAGFLHPLCTVHPGPGSRDEITGIYEWYRDMSPDINLEVESFVYDETQKVVYLNVVQTFHVFVSPFPPKPARLVVKVVLQKNAKDGKYYITQQEDYYQPEDVLNLTLPFLAQPLVYIKRFASKACGWNATVFSFTRNIAHSGMELLGISPRQAKISDHVHQE